MLAQTYDPRRRTQGNGVTTTYAAPPVIDEGDLVVQLYNRSTGALTAQVLNTDYTVTGADTFISDDDSTRAAASVIFTSAPTATYDVLIDRIPDDDQAADFTEGDGLPAEALERTLDKQAMAIQAIRLLLTRALLLPDGEAFEGLVDGDGAAITGLGLPAQRKGMVIGFDVDTGALRLVPQTNGAKGDKGDAGEKGDAGDVNAAPDGALATPAISWANDTADGWYRAGSHDQRYGINGADVLQVVATGFNISGALDVSGRITAAKLALDISSPAQITATQNDYALPTGGQVRLDLDAARSITGFAAPATADRVTITNISSFDLTFEDADTGSSAANRFSMGADYILPGGATVEFFYDLTSARWRIYATRNIASATEIWAGTSGSKLVTPANLKAAFAWQDEGTITSASTLSINGANGFRQQFQVGSGNFTLGAPSGLIPGRDYVAQFTQASTARTWGTPDAAWKFPGGTNQALTATANAIDYLFFTALTATTAVANMLKKAS